MQDYVVDVIKKFAPLNGFGVEPANNIDEIVQGLLSNEDVICICKPGKGVILGLKYHLYYNPNVTLVQELGWWVEPEYRNTMVGIKLLKEFEAEAKRRNADKIVMVYLEAQTPDRVDRMLQRMNYKHIEYNMVKDL